MAKTNGKSDVDTKELDLEHELPPSDEATEEERQSAEAQPSPAKELESELEKVKAERDALLDRLARLQAEFENARKRVAREQQEYREYAVSDALKALLPVLDSFDRALQGTRVDGSDLRAGIELINKQLHDALAKLGVRLIPAKGEPFDPHLHEAIEVVETDEVEDHHVLDELQKGYKFKDRLLRPAMVRVSRKTKS
jgi:molecular chaperone GrpE